MHSVPSQTGSRFGKCGQTSKPSTEKVEGLITWKIDEVLKTWIKNEKQYTLLLWESFITAHRQQRGPRLRDPTAETLIAGPVTWNDRRAGASPPFSAAMLLTSRSCIMDVAVRRGCGRVSVARTVLLILQHVISHLWPGTLSVRLVLRGRINSSWDAVD